MKTCEFSAKAMIRILLSFTLPLLMLIACSAREAPPAADMPDEVTSSFNVATASGKILPAMRATMSFEVGGQLLWAAPVGSQVNAGDVVARLDGAQAEAAVGIARAAVEIAEAQLARARSGVRPEEIDAAEAAVEVARANLAAAEETLEQAREYLNLAVEAAQASIDQSQAALDVAQAELARVSDIFEASDPEVAAVEAQLRIAEAGVEATDVAYRQAQLSAQSNIALAEAQLQAAEGHLDQAIAQRDALIAGSSAGEAAVLQAQVSQANASLTQAEVMLAKTTLLAPFAGTVGSVNFHPGESLLPGQPVLSLGDLSILRVETTDFNEVDAIQVPIGAMATLTFDALPGMTLEGEVTQIAPMATLGQGGTNFTLIIEMRSPPSNLRWGMTAFVDIALD